MLFKLWLGPCHEMFVFEGREIAIHASASLWEVDGRYTTIDDACDDGKRAMAEIQRRRVVRRLTGRDPEEDLVIG